jgi:hypothetical protein
VAHERRCVLNIATGSNAIFLPGSIGGLVQIW